MTSSLDLLAGRHDRDTVVVDGTAGRTHTVADLRRLGGALLRGLPAGGKALVQLVADRSPAALAAYVECLRRGHAVMLTDARMPADRQRAAQAALRPDAVLDTRTGAVEARPDAVPRGPRPAVPDPVAVLLATSGSMGAFRFVCLTYRNVLANAGAIALALGLTPEDRGALTLPVSYSYGLSVFTSHMVSGGSVAIAEQAPTARGFWPWFDAARCTVFAGVPETYRMLDALGPPFRGRPTLRLATQAGGRLPEGLAARTADLLAAEGAELALMYGQTEATARITCHRGPTVLRHPGSVGVPVPGTTVRVLGPDGTERPPGEAGEIAVSGPGVMLGYARTRTDLAELPPSPAAQLRTGDLGRWSDGGLHVTGRLRRIAKPFGVRVHLDEVEGAYAAVGPAAVFADEHQVISVHVEDDPRAFRAVHRRVLAAYGLPPSAVRLVRVGRIPRTLSGKVRYADLPRSAAAPADHHHTEESDDRDARA